MTNQFLIRPPQNHSPPSPYPAKSPERENCRKEKNKTRHQQQPIHYPVIASCSRNFHQDTCFSATTTGRYTAAISYSINHGIVIANGIRTAARRTSPRDCSGVLFPFSRSCLHETNKHEGNGTSSPKYKPTEPKSREYHYRKELLDPGRGEE